MRPMHRPDDAAERGQDDGMASLALSPPRVQGLFGLSSVIMRERSRTKADVLMNVRYYHLQ